MFARIQVLAVLLVAWLSNGPALGQEETPAELRNEIALLRERVSALEAEREQLAEELDAVRIENQALADRVRAAEDRARSLEEQLAKRPSEPAPSGQEPTTSPPASEAPKPVETPREAPIPTDPLASPASMLRTLRESWERSFAGLSLETEEARTEYQRRLTQWADSVQRSMHGNTRWRLLITEIQPGARLRDAAARFQVIDPGTGLPIGKSFQGTIPSRMFLKMDSVTEPQLWDVTLTLKPKPTINTNRLSAGAFDYPPLIGPMVEFQFDFDWIGMKRISEASAPTPDNPQPDGAPKP